MFSPVIQGGVQVDSRKTTKAILQAYLMARSPSTVNCETSREVLS